MAALLGFVVSFSAYAEESTAEVTPSADETNAMREAEAMGSRIFSHDMAAAAATDALSKVRGFKRNRQLRGWITQERGDGLSVTFIGGKKGAVQAALYRVEVGLDGTVRGEPLTLETPEPLTPFELAAATARDSAMQGEFEPCSKNYNAVVLPQDDELKRWRVYLLPGTTKQNLVPLGGSYRFDVDIEAENTRIRPYTKTCIQLDSPAEAVALMTSHLLDPVPTEVHVFWSIWARKPMYVATVLNGSLWAIKDAKISLVRRRTDD
jgi:hypothetical protein